MRLLKKLNVKASPAGEAFTFRTKSAPSSG